MDKLDYCLGRLEGRVDEFTMVERVDGGLELRDAAGRRVLVGVEREDGWLLFSVELATVASIAHLSVHQLGKLTLLWNRDQDLVTRAIDLRGRLVALCSNQEATLDPNELAAMLRVLLDQCSLRAQLVDTLGV